MSPTPTVGRIVHYTPHRTEPIAKGGGKLAAIVTHVWSVNLVNLTVFDANGIPTGRTSVPLLQEGTPAPEQGFYCEWMPYQKGQAAKTEELEQKLAQVEGLDQTL